MPNLDIKKPRQRKASQGWKSEELFHALINTMTEAVIAIGENDRIFLFNPAAEILFGRKSNEIIGKRLDELIPKEYRKKHRRYIKDFFSVGAPEGAANQIIEIPGLRSGGEEFSMEISLSTGHSDGKNFIVAVARDISDKKQALAALKASEEKYRTLQENLPLGIYRSTPQGKILAVNQAFVSILGYKSRFEVLSLSSFDFYLEQKYREELMARLEKEGAITNFEAQLLRNDGTALWASISVKAVKDEEGTILHLDGIVEDIRERKKVEQALIESEAKYRILAETAQDIILMHDLEGKLIYTNQAGLNCLKYSREEIEGKSVIDFVAPEDHEEVIKRQKLRLKGNTELLLYNINLIDSEGKYIPFEVSTSVVKEKGKPVMCLVFGRDLSARKKLEDQLNQSQRMESIGTLAGGIAHDFNNLITIINGLSEISLRRLENDHPIYRDLRSIFAAGKKAEELTRKLLAFSRKQIIHPKITDINIVIADLDKMLRRLIREDIEIEMNLFPQILHIKADPGQIEQILINLIVNARDAIGEKQDNVQKKIKISTRPVKIDESFSKENPDSQPGSYILISVSDSGIGMDNETIDKIFEPFYTTKEKGHGTGLGMSTVYGIIKQNSGFISIESKLNHGSTINVYWPSVDEKLPLEDPLTDFMPDDENLRGKECILVVEDDHDVRYFASFALRNLGYTVLEAKSGKEALDLAKHYISSENGSENIDLMITDLIMPGMNGKVVAEKIVKLSDSIKIIYTSGYSEESINGENIVFDEAKFLQKPFTIKMLAEKVKKILTSA
ncbi:MAG: PAS domain S-box protein [Calditrichia bacterium]|nr:PAS domain S-box protein [Calditrichia bacterium]